MKALDLFLLFVKKIKIKMRILHPEFCIHLRGFTGPLKPRTLVSGMSYLKVTYLEGPSISPPRDVMFQLQTASHKTSYFFSFWSHTKGRVFQEDELPGKELPLVNGAHSGMGLQNVKPKPNNRVIYPQDKSLSGNKGAVTHTDCGDHRSQSKGAWNCLPPNPFSNFHFNP